MTYSIVAFQASPDAGPEWGVAVASKFLAVGSLVPWARCGAGAVATQALANAAYGPDGLARLGSGADARTVLDALLASDPRRDHRQVGLVDREGRAATFTGAACQGWAGGRTGPGYAVQGNVLVSDLVVARMADAFEATKGPLVERMMQALLAGDGAGGDRRGRQSASILVVRAGGGYQGLSDVAADLRVDDHPNPVGELKRLVSLHRFLFPAASELVWVEIDGELATEIRGRLHALGHDPGGPEGPYDDGVRRALLDFVGMENLEERYSPEPRIESKVLEWLREKSWLDDVRR